MIEVHEDPVKPQIEAGIRQVAASLGVIVGAFGMTALAGKMNIVVTVAPQIAAILIVVGPAVWGAAVWIGQMATRKSAKEVAALVPMVPKDVAKFK